MGPLGSICPDMLGSMRDEYGREDGLVPRLLFAFPSTFPDQHWTDDELSAEAESHSGKIISHLHSIEMMKVVDSDGGDVYLPHLVEFTEEARQRWVE
jgi:hypothetical protein